MLSSTFAGGGAPAVITLISRSKDFCIVLGALASMFNIIGAPPKWVTEYSSIKSKTFSGENALKHITVPATAAIVQACPQPLQ